ncbi:MAG: type II toxin-antitoxin system VapC family toxin [Gorillibacterium sp.]|nr:type II toxin-antitoxin system VapC family toxin [Gorillibacterium sp.]
MNILLDTNVISELVRKQPNNKVVNWIESSDESSLYLSVITLGELVKGIAKLRDETRVKLLERWVYHDLIHRFDGRILALDASVMVRWGRIQGHAARDNFTLPVMDSMIAAIAIEHKMIVATRNTDDLIRCGADVINPWNT